jgi:preprotein translocase SecE subunit
MADDKPEQKNKRRVKNPETFRERALKASETGGKPDRTAGVKRAGGKLAKPAAKPLKKASRSKPLRILGKILAPAYLRNSWAELKKVTWPDAKQSRALTGAVLIFAIVFGVIVAAVDWGLDRIFRDIILRT